VRKLSHSSIPIFSAVAVAPSLPFLLVETVAAGAGAASFAFLFVSGAFAQESTKRPVKIHIIKRRDLDILFSQNSRMAKRADNTTFVALHVADSVLHWWSKHPPSLPNAVNVKGDLSR
jgi:hypothetical protein